MKPRTAYLSLLAALLFICCTGNTNKELLAPGVSKHLAQFRKENCKDVQYNLHFNIPGAKDSPVKGNVEILLDAQEEIPAIMDFRAEDSMVDSVLLNGAITAYSFENEHIIIEKIPSGENSIKIYFTSPDKSLNRRDNFLYTLLVPDRARTVFPCFEQPDIKGLYSLSMDVPQGWCGIANGKIQKEEELENGRRRIHFSRTEPLSTYLFSFVAGVFERETYERAGREISIYHRETDPAKKGQCPQIAAEVFDALEWLEEYTAIPYPFAKYDLIILPGFQYGGMEHTGATLYNDRRMFLSQHPTLNEKLGRSSLIAHETAHMWFGDYVTMEWFNDVWTKEVFANYFASKMVEPLLSQVNHKLNFLTDYFPGAYAEDRTDGANSVKQSLDNLQNAGLVYGNIIYDKSPIVMEMLVKELVEENFRKGIQEYLNTYAYGNATWEGLIKIFDNLTTTDLQSWSNSWINVKGMPEISAAIADGQLAISQSDTWNRGTLWPQELEYTIIFKDTCTGNTPAPQKVYATFGVGDSVAVAPLAVAPISAGTASGSATQLPSDAASYVAAIIPNSNGEGYGYFKLDTTQLEHIWAALEASAEGTTWDTASAKKCREENNSREAEIFRGSLLINLYENLRRGNLAPQNFMENIVEYLGLEQNQLLYSMALGYTSDCHRLYLRRHKMPEDSGEAKIATDGLTSLEAALWKLVANHKEEQFRVQAFRTFRGIASSGAAIEKLYGIWERQTPPAGCHLSENDYISLSYMLAIHMPGQAAAIVEKQLGRITNPDRIAEYKFISPSVSPHKAVRDSVFNSLLLPENRRVEPWASSALGNLNHPLREYESLEYILPALEIMPQVQRTGDIFFPSNWARALLGGHTSPEAAAIVEGFFAANPDFPVMLGNKIRHQAWHLKRH